MTSVAVSADGRRVIAALLSKSVLCLDDRGDLWWRNPVGNQAWRLGLSDDGQTIVAGTGSTYPWDMRGRGLYCFDGSGALRWKAELSASVWGLSLAADGHTIAAGTTAKQLLLLDDQGNRLWQLDVPGLGWYAWVWSAALSANGQVVAAGAADKRIRILDRAGNLRANHLARADVFTVAVSADGSRVAAADSEGYVYLLDQNGHLLWQEQLEDGVWRVQLSQDGQRLLVGSSAKDVHLRVYDLNGRLVWRRFVGGTASCLGFSADGRRLAAGTNEGAIYVFDEGGDILHRAQAQKKVRDVALSADGRTVAAGAEDGLVYGFRFPHPPVLTEPEGSADTMEPVPLRAAGGRSFGALLRHHRYQTKDPQRGGRLTQDRLAELLYLEPNGPNYSYATISNWERNLFPIPHTDRYVLITLLRVLHRCGGLRTAEEANELLFAGGYRHLDGEEQDSIFGKQT
ncbi:MAG: PQQ-binding-like beta-propeller repeat protein [Chloroflexota bacterium]